VLVLAHYIPGGHPTDEHFARFVEALHLPFHHRILGPVPVDGNWRPYSGPAPDPSPSQNYLYGLAAWDPLRPMPSRPGAMDGGVWVEPFWFRSGQWAVATAYSPDINAATAETVPDGAVIV
jgi:hypothetical protein